MEAKKLVVGTAYATCDGAYVVPQDLEKRYAWRFDKDKKKDVLVEFGKDGRVDPWSDCHITRERGRRHQTGIKCQQFEVDRDGQPVSKGVIVVIPPREIKGTWSDYLLLYAQHIQESADRREFLAAMYATRDEMLKRLHVKFPKAQIGVYERQNYETRKRWAEYEVRLGPLLETKMQKFFEELGV